MKVRKILLIYCLVSFFCGSIAFATASKEQITVEFLDLKYYLNGSLLKLSEENKGFIYKGNAYAPIEMLCAVLGKEATWVKKDESILINDKNIESIIIKPLPYSKITGYNIFDRLDFGNDADNELPKSVEVLTSAEYDEDNNQWLWDDGQRWVVRITNGITDYVLFDEYVQIGTVEIFNATENYISFLVKTHRQFITIYRCTFNSDKNQYIASSQVIKI